MVIHELVINAMRHGALSAPGGRVQIRWSLVEQRAEPWLSLSWAERGGPKPAAHTGTVRRGFGTDMIERRIAYELGGSGRLGFAHDGAWCQIDFPIRHGTNILETLAPVERSDHSLLGTGEDSEAADGRDDLAQLDGLL